MEQIAAVQTAAPQVSLRSILGMAAGQQAQGDAFAMIFQQLMGQEDGFGSLLSQLAGVQQDDQEKANELGMQMMAEMLYANPDIQNLLPLMQQVMQPEESVQSVGQGIRNSVAALQNPVVQPEEKESEQPVEKAEAKDFYTVLQDSWKERQPSFGIRLEGDTLRQARQLLAQKPKETVQAQDVESLQADVDARRFLSVESVAPQKLAELTDVQEIADQLKTGIAENISQGKNEFIVRLKPEGLGEVVVKLSENKEKIALSIFTSSEQTAKWITDEVLSLQNALRPLHAEVQQVTVTPDGRVAEYAAQNSMNDQSQQFAGQQFAEQWQQSFRSRMQDSGDFGSVVEQILPDDGLDTYI